MIDQEADYVLALTQNQPQLYDPVTEMFTYERSTDFRNCRHDFHQTVEKGHGRMEPRRCGAVADPEYLQYVNDDQTWPHLQSLVMDVGFREDDSRIRRGHGPQNMARPEGTRHRLALNLLRQETSVKSGIAAKRKRAGWNLDYLHKVLAQ